MTYIDIQCLAEKDLRDDKEIDNAVDDTASSENPEKFYMVDNVDMVDMVDVTAARKNPEKCDLVGQDCSSHCNLDS